VIKERGGGKGSAGRKCFSSLSSFVVGDVGRKKEKERSETPGRGEGEDVDPRGKEAPFLLALTREKKEDRDGRSWVGGTRSQ